MTRQLQVISGIIGNWEDASNAFRDAEESAGTAKEASDIWASSIEFHIQQFKSKFEELSQTVVDSDFAIFFVDLGKALLDALNSVAKLINAVGGLKTVMVATASIVAGVGAQKIILTLTSATSGVKNLMATLRNLGTTLISLFKKETWAPIKTAITDTINSAEYSGDAARLAAAGVTELSAAQDASAVSAAMNAAAQAEVVIADEELINAGTIAAMSEDELALSEAGVAAASEAAAVGEASAAVGANAVGTASSGAAIGVNSLKVAFGSLVAVLSIAIMLYRKYHKTAAERFEEENKEYIEEKSNLEDLNEQYKENKSRIEELNSLKTSSEITIAQEEELDNLNRINSQLEVEIENEKELLKLKAQDSNEALVRKAENRSTDIYDIASRYYRYNNGSSRSHQTASTMAQDLNSKISSTEEYANKLLEFYNHLSDKIYDENGKINDDVKALYDDIKIELASLMKELDGYIDDYVGSDENTDHWNNLYGRIASTLYPSAYKKEQLDYIDSLTGFKNAAENGYLRVEQIGNILMYGEEGYKLKAAMDALGMSVSDLVRHYYELAYAENEAAESADDIKPSNMDILESVHSLSDGLDLLVKIYDDVANGGDFDFGSIIGNEDFAEQFGNLDYYNEFIETIANSPKDIKKCQDAFNLLANEYIRSSGALDNLTDETRDATVAMLNQVGIENAAEIVDSELAYQKSRLAIESLNVTNAINGNIDSFISEGEAAGIATDYLYRYAAEKMIANANVVNTSGDIKNLANLAAQCVTTIDALNQLAKAKKLMEAASTLQANINNGVYKGIRAAEGIAAQDLVKRYTTQAESILKGLVNSVQPALNGAFANFTGGGGGGSSSSGGGGSSSEESNWFKEQLALHKHLVAMEMETQKDYITWLNAAYEKAYKEGIITLDEYYQYQEEVFEGLKELFDDEINDLEHEISMREAYDLESKKIIEIYKTMISNVEKQLKSAKDRGLKNEDEYVQELQSKWNDYTSAIKDIYDEVTDNAKSAMDDLVDYAMDMLKDDVDNQKDALSEKLDMLKEFYDKQKKMIQDTADEEKYLAEQEEKRKSVSDLKAQLDQLQYDNSAWAQKRILELTEELNNAQKELDDFEKDHALDLALEALDNTYEAQQKEIEAQIDALEDMVDDPERLYNKALSMIQTNTGGLYAEIRDCITWLLACSICRNSFRTE